jgi:dihydropyrimidinase
MKDFDLVVRGGMCATAADVQRCDIGVRDGKIVAFAESLPAGLQEFDARGKLVMPGGVDAHCHLDQPMSDGARMADDFASGSYSAACGGTTTVIPFACQFKGQSLHEAVEDYHRRSEGKSVVDYAFHLIVSDPNPKALESELPKLIRDGYTSFKIYMTYDDMKLNDRQILDVLALARREGAMTMIHAENTDCIAWLTEQLEAAGKTEPKYHAFARPMLVEREATHRAISFAELMDVPVLIVHVSGAEAVEQIRWGQSRGLKIFAETCPQYLFLSEEDLDVSVEHGMRCICSPPPRGKHNQKVIWDGLMNGVFQVFSSDHAPFRFDDPQGKQLNGPNASFSKIPNGIPGLETRMPLLFSEGVLTGKITLQQFVALTCSNPAKMYGLYPRKGTLAVGSDADIVVWDYGKALTITNSMLHHNVDYTPYEGRQVSAWPQATFVRGQLVQCQGKLLVSQGYGQFLPCDRPTHFGITKRPAFLDKVVS